MACCYREDEIQIEYSTSIRGIDYTSRINFNQWPDLLTSLDWFVKAKRIRAPVPLVSKIRFDKQQKTNFSSYVTLSIPFSANMYTRARELTPLDGKPRNMKIESNKYIMNHSYINGVIGVRVC